MKSTKRNHYDPNACSFGKNIINHICLYKIELNRTWLYKIKMNLHNGRPLTLFNKVEYWSYKIIQHITYIVERYPLIVLVTEQI